MATLVSPGVSVTVIDESFYIPAAAPTVPLFFIASRKGKYQPGNSKLSAAGTLENSVVRTVTSIGQSVQLYGVPYFWKDSSDNEFHGDARNEYGLFALNQFLGIGNRAFVVRANVDLTDEASSFISAGVPVATSVKVVGTGNGTITGITAKNSQVKPQTITVVFNSGAATTATGQEPAKFTVSGSETGIIGTGVVGTMFDSSLLSFTVNEAVAVPATANTPAIPAVPFVGNDYFEFVLEYAPTSYAGAGNGKISNLLPDTSAVAGTYTVEFVPGSRGGLMIEVREPVTNNVIGTGLPGYPLSTASRQISLIVNQGTIPFAAGDIFTVTFSSVTAFNPLGANDAAKRVAIVKALQAEINSNTEVRSEIYEYNLIVCPGYPEVVDELVALSSTVNDEAFVIGDTPVSKSSDQVAAWSKTAERARHQNVAYYYPWGLASNLDGRNVTVAPSGIALRTFAYSDNQSYVWFAPAGVQRGTVTGVANVGYVSGTLGSATTFTEVSLNAGQRDNLYEFGKNINPIVFFPNNGLIIWGQKTSYGAASALDRVNVMRLLMYIKRQLRKGAFPFVFEPNDKITRDNLKAAADGFLNDIMAKRGLYDFVTLCDESNNTPDRIDRNEMYLDVALKPVKAAEFIYIPIRVLSTGAQMPG